MVQNGVMKPAATTVRRSVSVPRSTATAIHRLAKSRNLSENRMIVDLINQGLEAEKRKETEFRELAERFRTATDPEEIQRLGDQLGRMVFGSAG